MKCEHSYKGGDYKYPLCKITKDNCPMIRYCGEINDYMQIDNYRTHCSTFLKEEDRKNRLGGENKVRFESDGFLYVELNDTGNTIVKIPNTFSSIPKYIDVVEQDGEYYLKGTEPSNSPPKKRKRKIPNE